jgi:hypothetical protein
MILIRLGSIIPDEFSICGTLAGPALMRSFVLGFSSSWISSDVGMTQPFHEAIVSPVSMLLGIELSAWAREYRSAAMYAAIGAMNLIENVLVAMRANIIYDVQSTALAV